MLEKLIYRTIYCYFEDSNLCFTCQSDFCKQDCGVSKLLTITHEFYYILILMSFSPPDTLAVFLDISMAFNGIIMKIYCLNLNHMVYKIHYLLSLN